MNAMIDFLLFIYLLVRQTPLEP